MAEYEIYMKIRAVRGRLDEAIRRDRVAFHRLRKMQADLPWWHGWMFAPFHAQHLGLRLKFSWFRLNLWFCALTLPARLRRLL